MDLQVIGCDWTGSLWFKNPVAGCCGHGYERPVPYKARNFLTSSIRHLFIVLPS